MKKFFNTAIIFTMTIGITGITQSCKKDTSPPEVWTLFATEVTPASAKSGGIVNDGGSEVTLRGVCWSTSPDPTTSPPWLPACVNFSGVNFSP